MKILIPNATSPKNTGDQAMLASLLNIIRTNFPDANIRIHSVDVHLQKKVQLTSNVESSLLSWMMFDRTTFFDRASRCVQAIVGLALPSLIFDKKLKNILRDFQKSDLIIFVGNGYLRSTKGISQSVLLFLQLVPFLLAKQSKKRVIVGPMSFGPFAYKWQEMLSATILSGLSPLLIREEISLALTHKYHLTHAQLTADLALLLPNTSQGSQPQKDIGISLRNWYAPRVQRRLEKELVATLISFMPKTASTIKLFVNVDAPEHKDVDMIVAMRVYDALKKADVSVEKPIILRTYREAMDHYNSCRVLVGMRMHANILAATQAIPFVGIAYEHKTMGIAKMLGMQQYCLWGYEVTSEKLLPILQYVFDNHIQIQKDLQKTHGDIRATNDLLWKNLLTKSFLD